MYERLRRILSDMSGVPEDRITPGTRVGDLIDSLGVVELSLVAEEELTEEGRGVYAREADVEPRDTLEMTVRELAQAWERFTR